MESALDAVRRLAAAEGASGVGKIVLRVGAISGVEPDALRFAFDALSPGTVARGATLEIETVPARAHCGACQRDFVIEQGFLFTCPHCGAFSGDVRSGRELELARVEFPELPRHEQSYD